MKSLAEIQEMLGQALLAERAVDPIVFKGDPELVGERFRLYRGNLRANLEKSLSGAFPVIKQLVGDEFFSYMVNQYGRSLVHNTGNLNQIGSEFPEFVKNYEPVASLGYAYDVAKLEWAVQSSAFARDSQPLDPISLLSLDAQALELEVLSLCPSVSLHHSSWNIYGIWQGHQSPTSLDTPIVVDVESFCVVKRPLWQVEVEAIDRGDFVFLKSLDGQVIFADALEMAVDADPNFKVEASMIRWFGAGVFDANAAI